MKPTCGCCEYQIHLAIPRMPSDQDSSQRIWQMLELDSLTRCSTQHPLLYSSGTILPEVLWNHLLSLCLWRSNLALLQTMSPKLGRKGKLSLSFYALYRLFDFSEGFSFRIGYFLDLRELLPFFSSSNWHFLMSEF